MTEAHIPVLDCHNDLPFALREEAGYSVERLDEVRSEFHTDLVRLRKGGVSGQFWSVWVPSSIPQSEAVVATLEQIDAVHRMVAAYPQDMQIALTAAQVREAFAAGKVASLMGMEGGQSIANSPAVLREMYALGVRYMTLTHNDDLEWATSATGVREAEAEAAGAPGAPGGRSDIGLTEEGRAVVAEMNRLGMMVDISHTNERTQLDALECSTAPVFFSHSSVQSVNPHPRNVTDRVLEQVAAKDAVLGVTFVPGFVSPAVHGWNQERAALIRDLTGADPDSPLSVTRPYWMPAAPRAHQCCEEVAAANAKDRVSYEYGDSGEEMPEEVAKKLAAWEEANPQPVATMADVVAHIEAAREAVGVDRLALGGDYDGTGSLPEGLEHVGCYQDLFAELSSRGWSEKDLRKLGAENVLGLMERVEAAAG